MKRIAALVVFSVVACTSPAAITNSILYVTQTPVPYETNANLIAQTFTSIASTFGNHRGDTLYCARGGDLMIRYPDGSVSNLTRGAGYGTNGFQGANAIGVRQPAVHWSGTKALFSMVVGAPTNAAASTNQNFFWQLYEVTNLAKGQAALITRITNQPPNFNNISPAYGTDDRIIFTSDRPRDGSTNLYPQLDEYFDSPIVTGIWSLDPASGDLQFLEHAPSGSFNPFVDSFGRIVFTRWDHFVRDRYATTDGFTGTNQTFNGTFNYASETSNVYDLNNRFENYPEPRNFDTNTLQALGVNGNAFNQFFGWTCNEDGSEEETFGHVGRHDLVAGITKSFTNDPNLVTLSAMTNRASVNTNQITDMFWISEDAVSNGIYYGVDAVDVVTFGAGQLFKINAGVNVNPEQMAITYLTPRSTFAPTNGSSADATHTGFYRSPRMLTDGSLVCIHTTNKGAVANTGTLNNPKTAYDFRLKLLTNIAGYYQPAAILTPDQIVTNAYYAGGQLITYQGRLWELDPVEVVARTRPLSRVATMTTVEQSVFDAVGVDMASFRQYLITNNLALLISRNMTTRDKNDKQQPFNLRVPGGVSSVVTNSDTNWTYNIEHLQVFQADQIRGVTLGGTNPLPGRRVLPVPLHDVWNPPDTNAPVAGATSIFPDGSQATLVPARRAVTWNLVGANTNALFAQAASPAMSVVKEKYWLSFAPGEIRTCTSCHGLSTADQLGRTSPTNQPLALRNLLLQWKAQTKFARIQSANSDANGNIALQISGIANGTNIVAASSDFVQWVGITTNTGGTNGVFQAIIPGPQPMQVYRAETR